jgi:hypothetical protein
MIKNVTTKDIPNKELQEALDAGDGEVSRASVFRFPVARSSDSLSHSPIPLLSFHFKGN